jgi:hypothetical protein
VVVHDLDIFRAIVPTKADAELVIYTHAPLPSRSRSSASVSAHLKDLMATDE